MLSLCYLVCIVILDVKHFFSQFDSASCIMPNQLSFHLVNVMPLSDLMPFVIYFLLSVCELFESFAIDTRRVNL